MGAAAWNGLLHPLERGFPETLGSQLIDPIETEKMPVKLGIVLGGSDPALGLPKQRASAAARTVGPVLIETQGVDGVRDIRAFKFFGNKNGKKATRLLFAYRGEQIVKTLVADQGAIGGVQSIE